MSERGKAWLTEHRTFFNGNWLRGKHFRIIRETSMIRLSTSRQSLNSSAVSYKTRIPSASVKARRPDSEGN